MGLEKINVICLIIIDYSPDIAVEIIYLLRFTNTAKGMATKIPGALIKAVFMSRTVLTV